jgi:hypothetical protein
MAIVLPLKKVIKPAPAVTTGTQLSEHADLIDEVGEMQAEAEKIESKIAELTAKLAPYKAKLAELQGLLNEDDTENPDAKRIEYGKRFAVEVGKQGSSTVITDLPKIAKFVGTKLFYELATMKITDIKAYLTPPQLAEVTKIQRTKRSVKVVRQV